MFVTLSGIMKSRNLINRESPVSNAGYAVAKDHTLQAGHGWLWVPKTRIIREAVARLKCAIADCAACNVNACQVGAGVKRIGPNHCGSREINIGQLLALGEGPDLV